MARGQTALGRGEVTLRRKTRSHSVVLLRHRQVMFWVGGAPTHVRSYADDEVFLHLRTGQAEPAGTGGLGCTRGAMLVSDLPFLKYLTEMMHLWSPKKVWIYSNKFNLFYSPSIKPLLVMCFTGQTHGVCGAVWAAPDGGRLRRRHASSSRGHADPGPASCSGQRRTDRPAPEQTTGRPQRRLTFQNKKQKRCRSFRCNLRTDTSSAAAPTKLVFCLSGMPFAECLYGFSVTSCGCFTSSDGSMFFMGTMLKAYRY